MQLRADGTHCLQYITDLFRGGLKERLLISFLRVTKNMMDINMDPDAWRTITITLKLKPMADRRNFVIKAKIGERMPAEKPIETLVGIQLINDDELRVTEAALNQGELEYTTVPAAELKVANQKGETSND